MAIDPTLLDYTTKAQRRFVLLVLATCLILQRVALPSSGLQLSIAAPIIAAAALWYVGKGVLAIDRTRLAIMFGLIGVALLSFDLAINAPSAMVTRTSVPSLIVWLVFTSFAVLRFTIPMQERVFFGLVTRCLSWIAICGIAAFLAQFVGLKLFSFKGFLPDRYSFEPMYNVVIPLAPSGVIRANGFFLVEPSVFSQFMALGLAVEWLNERRNLVLALFLFALFASISGTGWLVVGSFILGIAILRGGRGLKVGIIFSCVCVVAFLIVGMLLPEVTESLQGRIYEFWEPGSSGYGRFATPIMVLTQMFDVHPMALLTGLGPGSSQALTTIAYRYGTSAPGKILLEYGVLGLLAYVALILANRRTRAQKLLLWPALSILVFGGAYDHFPPVLFPVLLVITVSNLYCTEGDVVERRVTVNPSRVPSTRSKVASRG